MKLINKIKSINGKWYLLLAYLLIIAFCIMAQGCRIAEKAVSAYKNSPEFPNDCAASFPPTITKGSSDTILMPGKIIDCDSVLNSTKQLENDTIYAIETRTVKVKCPPHKVIHRVDTFINNALLEASKRQAKREIEVLVKEINKQDLVIKNQAEKIGNLKKQRNWFSLTTLLSIILMFLFFRKKQNK